MFYAVFIITSKMSMVAWPGQHCQETPSKISHIIYKCWLAQNIYSLQEIHYIFIFISFVSAKLVRIKFSAKKKPVKVQKNVDPPKIYKTKLHARLSF